MGRWVRVGGGGFGRLGAVTLTLASTPTLAPAAALALSPGPSPRQRLTLTTESCRSARPRAISAWRSASSSKLVRSTALTWRGGRCGGVRARRVARCGRLARVHAREPLRAGARPRSTPLGVAHLLLAPLGLLGGVPRLYVVVLLGGHRRRVVVLAKRVEVLLDLPLAAVLVHDALRGKERGRERREGSAEARRAKWSHATWRAVVRVVGIVGG